MTVSISYEDQLRKEYILISTVDIKTFNSFFLNKLDKEILKICYAEPQTLKEIYNKYGYKTKRNENTLYKRIQQLIRNNLLLECGLRSYENKLVRSMLYQIKSQFILYKEYFEFTENEALIQTIKVLLQENGFYNERLFSNIDILVSKMVEASKKFIKNILQKDESIKAQINEYLHPSNMMNSERTFIFNNLLWYYAILNDEQNFFSDFRFYKEQRISKKSLPRKNLQYRAKTDDFVLERPDYIQVFFPYGNEDLKQIKYRAIISLLDEQPLTITELGELHFERCKSIQKNQLYNSAKKPKAYSQASLYRLIQDLVKVHIVKEIGTRRIGQTNHRLYGLSAEILFYTIELDKLVDKNDLQYVVSLLHEIVKGPKDRKEKVDRKIQEMLQKIVLMDKLYVESIQTIRSEAFIEKCSLLKGIDFEILAILTKLLLVHLYS